MDAKLAAEALALRRTAERLARVGLIVDPACLSPAHRRAVFALQCAAAAAPDQPEPKRPPIGFAYPNAR